MRLGLFGGTFDPVHYGHLLLAECCREQCALDQVWFVPCGQPPHKRRELTPGHERVEMLQLATSGYAPFSVCSLEIDRPGTSFTVDTLAEIRQSQSEAELFFLMGADSLHDLPGWREPARILELATLVVVRRPQTPPPDFSLLAPLLLAEPGTARRDLVVDMPQLDYSSKVLRDRVAAGQSIRFRTPRAVEKYIETHGLYQKMTPTG
jgi:nicotinate-nucleotide adenylyltransferase